MWLLGWLWCASASTWSKISMRGRRSSRLGRQGTQRNRFALPPTALRNIRSFGFEREVRGRDQDKGRGRSRSPGAIHSVALRDQVGSEAGHTVRRRELRPVNLSEIFGGLADGAWPTWPRRRLRVTR